ncbi:hypothetical protein F5Y00DRAFT_255105 [Daldinia vernicosa]|uniref:uncharacterized protein n=1 Tax=Daldinia vernicosa TaxID=114800 RepID=UPI0020082ED4|nr:uncharacterized protein F5Y00DRAFT_255105 [Daldinia vernicosa]KAI0845642.1 hypothetical protein F5Y00DRAFT_255105 [Daldinia vernicosa]
MPSTSSQKRTQFSSCDACRRSRVACDASKRGYQPGKVSWAGSCSRCTLKRRPCTFEWINAAKRKPLNPYREAVSHSSTETDPTISCESNGQAFFISTHEQSCDQAITQNSQSGNNTSPHDQYDADRVTPLDEPNAHSIEPLDPQAESIGVFLTSWCDQIFLHGFGTFFGLITGRNGCPFVNNPTSEVCIPPTELFRKLDADMDDAAGRQTPNSGLEVQAQQERDIEIDQSLKQTIRSFAAHWLPLASSRSHFTTSQVEEFIRESWRMTRKDMLKVVNRTSYRSALTLYLFSQTPVPIGISEEEELNGISGLVCIQTALLQIQRLRERQRSHQFRASEVSAWADIIVSSSPDLNFTEAYLDFESRAYWAAVVWDTSNSLTLNLRTSLTSGLNGACSEPAWRLVRAFLGSFHTRANDWRSSGFDISDDIASQIIAGAAISMLYIWKNITSIKEALREGVEEEAVLFAWNAFLGSSDVFKTSNRPLLNILERRLHFLSQSSRLAWYEINSRYNLGILILCNSLLLADRSDLLSQITELRRDAERESFNNLKFGLENTYTISRHSQESDMTSPSRANSPQDQMTVSLIALDPHPNRVIDSVLLMSKVISNEYRQGKIKHENYSYLSSILSKTLEELPRNAKTVQAARESLKQSIREINEAAEAYVA